MHTLSTPHPALFMSLTLCLGTVAAKAQNTTKPQGEHIFVVADAITHTPLRDVIIYTDNNQSVKTNYRGEFILAGRHFRRITIGHAKYYSRVMEPQDFRQDTIVMIPKIHTLADVEVIGHQHQGAFFKPITKEEMTMAHPQQGGPNILGMIGWAADKLFVDHHKMSQKEKLQKALENY